MVPASLVTGGTIYFMAKRRLTDADADAILSKTSEEGGGITIEDAIAGTIITRIDPADSRVLSNSKTRLCYEVEIEKNTNIYYIDSGDLTVLPELIQRALP